MLKNSMAIILPMIFIIMIPINSALANSAPVIYQNSKPGFNVVIDKDNKVRITNENLNFYIKDKNSLRNASVSAEYTIINEGPSQDMYVVFPYIGGTQITAYLDGKEIRYEYQKTTGIKIDSLRNDVSFVDSSGYAGISLDGVIGKILNGVSIPNWNDPDGFNVIAAFFKIPLEQGKTQGLIFNYSQWAGELKPKGFLESKKYNYDYLIEPARYWSDFKNFNLSISVPKDIKIDNSTLELQKNTRGSFDIYTYNSATLPDKNLRFSVDSGTANLFESIAALLIIFVLIGAAIAVTAAVIVFQIVNRKKAIHK